MKCKVIKEYAGIEAGQEIEVNDKVVNHLIESGYVEQIIEPIDPISSPLSSDHTQNIKLTIEGRKLAPALNKAIEPKYKRNKI